MRKFIAATALVAMVTSPVAAQQSDFRASGPAHGEGRVTVGLVLPFGGRKAQRAPQVELRLARDVIRWDGQRESTMGGPIRESRIGLTLDGTERLMINGREQRVEDRQGVSTLGGVAIGVGVAVVVGGLLMLDALRDSSE